MEWKTFLIVLLAVTIVLFVPFYPFRLVKRLVFFLLNKFVPLKFKFDDIGGVPIIGIRLFNVRIALKGQSTIEARELRLRINLWKILMFSRPTVDPITLIDPKIMVYREKEKGELWFLFPFTIAKKVVGFLFANLWGLSKVRIRNGEIVMHGTKGDTTITKLNGLFLSLGGNVTVRSMSCSIGEGTVEMVPITSAVDSDIRVRVRNLHLEDLVALKVPKTLTGAADIDAVMPGGFGAVALNGEMNSACLYLREQPIRNFHAPMHFEGTTLTLSPMRGEIGDYVATGILENDVETDRVHLKLHGTGVGRGPGLIFKMLNMKPYLNSAEIDARIDLEGDFEIFTDIAGEIKVRLRDARVNPEAFSEKAGTGKPMPRIPELNFDLFMQEGSLYTESIDAVLPGSRVHLDGRIDMTLDQELDKVTETKYDLNISVKNEKNTRSAAETAGSLSLPAEFDAKLQLETSQRLDPTDFDATGKVELKNVLIEGKRFGLPTVFANFLEIFFRGIRGEMNINAKRILLKDVHLDAIWLYTRINGEVGLDGSLDLIARARVLSSNEETGQSGLMRLPLKIISRLKGGVHITGTISKPKFQLIKNDQMQ